MYRHAPAPDQEAHSPETNAPPSGGQSWFDLAYALARTGAFRDAEEVEAALLARGDAAAPSRNAIVRDAIALACERTRREQGLA